jgi:hypothetical protein
MCAMSSHVTVNHSVAQMRQSVQDDVGGPDPVADPAEVVRRLFERMLPPVGAHLFANFIYTIGQMRSTASPEGAAAVNRAGHGKVHRAADQRADATSIFFLDWARHGGSSDKTAASVAKVKAMHDHYGASYSMSNETFVAGICLFALLFETITSLLGVELLSEAEKVAQVEHWRAIGEQLGVRDMPDTWAGMQSVLYDYEHSPQWFYPTAEAHQCAAVLIEQFNQRWLPRPLHGLGRTVFLSLHEDHVLWALGYRKPAAPAVWLVRKTLAGALLARQALTSNRKTAAPLARATN